MFSFFKPKEKLPPYKDKIWISSKVRDINLISKAKKSSSKNKLVIVSSFEENLTHVTQLFQVIGLKVHRSHHLPDIAGHDCPILLHSKLLVPAPEYAQAEGFEAIFLEHYPLPEKDKAILRKTQIVLGALSLEYYTSLDSPLFQFFGGQRIIEMLQKIGLEENETVEHSLISSSIKRAQEKLSKSVPVEYNAENEAEWYRINFRENT